MVSYFNKRRTKLVIMVKSVDIFALHEERERQDFIG